MNNIEQPKYQLGQLVLFKTHAVVDEHLEHLDLGMIVNINPMRQRVFAHYTYDIEWFKDANKKHRYVEEEMIDEWVADYICFRKQNGL